MNQSLASTAVQTVVIIVISVMFLCLVYNTISYCALLYICTLYNINQTLASTNTATGSITVITIITITGNMNQCLASTREVIVVV